MRVVSGEVGAAGIDQTRLEHALVGPVNYDVVQTWLGSHVVEICHRSAVVANGCRMWSVIDGVAAGKVRVRRSGRRPGMVAWVPPGTPGAHRVERPGVRRPAGAEGARQLRQ